MLKKAAGAVMIVFGVLLVGWVGYNLLVEMQPEAKRGSPIGAIGFSTGLLFVGFKWLLDK